MLGVVKFTDLFLDKSNTNIAVRGKQFLDNIHYLHLMYNILVVN